MAKYKIEYDAEICIGTVACISEAPEYFIEDENGYTALNSATLNEETGKWEIVVEGDEDSFKRAQEAEGGCPVDAIKVTLLD